MQPYLWTRQSTQAIANACYTTEWRNTQTGSHRILPSTGSTTLRSTNLRNFKNSDAANTPSRRCPLRRSMPGGSPFPLSLGLRTLSSHFLVSRGPACAQITFMLDSFPAARVSNPMSATLCASPCGRVRSTQIKYLFGSKHFLLGGTGLVLAVRSVSSRLFVLQFAQFRNRSLASQASPANGVQHPIVSTAPPGPTVTPPLHIVTSVGAAPAEVLSKTITPH